MSRPARGPASELVFAAACEALGWPVAWPHRYAVPWDVLALIAGRWRSIQVKSARTARDRSPSVDLRAGHGQWRRTYSPQAFDALGVVLGHRVWLAPWPLVVESTRVCLDRLGPFELDWLRRLPQCD